MRFQPTRRAVGLILAVLLGSAVLAPPVSAAGSKSFLLLPIAGALAGQEWVGRSIGAVIEQGLGSLPAVRLIGGAAREAALKEMAAKESVLSGEFAAICRKAGADFGVLGGAILAGGRFTLELRLFDVAAEQERAPFRVEDEAGRAFTVAAAGVRYLVGETGGEISAVEKAEIERTPTVSLEAYATYRSALLEEQPERRIALLRQALALDPNYLDATLRLGVELFRQGAPAEAPPLMERAVSLGPEVAEAHNNYGVVLAAAARAEEAQQEFERALVLAPVYEEARLNLARVLEDRGRSGEAEKQYAKILEADPANDKARHGLAILFDRTNRPELAVKEFRVLSAKRPDLAEGEFIRAGQEARKAREYQKAEKYFVRAVDINPQLADAYAELGTNGYLAGDYQKGADYFRKALSLEPQRADFHYYLGLALEKGWRQTEAVQSFQRAVELGGPPEARLSLARVSLEAGDTGKAVEELNLLLAQHPDHAEAKVLLAQATAENETRRRLLEGQSQFANQRLGRLEQIIDDLNRTNRELEGRLLVLAQDKQHLEKDLQREREPGSRLREELVQERADRRRELGEVQARLAVVQADKERVEKDFAAQEERLRRETERFQAELAAAKASARELGQGSGEAVELRQRLAGLQADQARLQTEAAQEREARRKEIDRLKADLTAAEESLRKERGQKGSEAAELKGRLAAAAVAAEKTEQALAREREERRRETEKLKAELAVAQVREREKNQLALDLAAAQNRLATLQAAADKAEKNLAAAMEKNRQETEKLKADLAAAQTRKNEKEQLALDLAAAHKAEKELAAAMEKNRQETERLQANLVQAEAWRRERDQKAAEAAEGKGRLAEVQAAAEKTEQALVREREEHRQTTGRLATQLAAAEAQGKELGGKLEAEAREHARERVAASERTATLGGELEQARRALAEAQARTDELRLRLAATEGEGQRRLEELRAQSQRDLAARDAELAAGRVRERELGEQIARRGADLAAMQERAAALEAQAAAAARTAAERERALDKARQEIRDLALELGRILLRNQSWEKAQGYFEQVIEIDPGNGEAYYGLGEIFFHLGQYDRSKAMYQKAKEIY